jgi:squalene synthase HpnC
MMHTALMELSAPNIPDADTVMSHAGAENFPVAARVLSRRDRRHLLAIYGFARLADELGDELGGDRLQALDWLESELDRAYAGSARHPLLVRLQATLAQCELPSEPFVRLIDANRLDQRVARYESWKQLRAYCELSANPVGELVLRVFGLATRERIAQSDDVCTALQLIEHMQDLVEDVRRGRLYMPTEDLVRYGGSHEQVIGLVFEGREDADSLEVLGGIATHAQDDDRPSERLRETISFETARARKLLAAGIPLVRSVRGRPKLALAAFVAGGRAALAEIELAHFDVLGAPRRRAPRRHMRAFARVLAESRR